MSSIKEQWESYLRDVIPATASPVQREECMRAFYAGAASVFGGLIGGLSCEADTTAEDLAVIDGFHQELEAWNHRMKRLAREARQRKRKQN